MLGKTISHYQILEKLGEGGMGVVYKARDTHLDRLVALKVLPPEKIADPERKRRFVQEAKAASALNHPNIITIHDISSGNGADFIAMEFVKGKPLDRLLGRKGLPLSKSLKYAVQISDALARAHAAGIVHRDLKPANIMVTDEGLVKVLDFGLAKLVEPVESGSLAETLATKRDEPPCTEAGAIVGTVAYMSPEQAEGKKIDSRSDIFSFGSVLYEMTTGGRAFQRDSKISTLSAILRDDPKPASEVVEDIPKELERAIIRCLRKDPERRWQSMADIKVALAEIKEETDSGSGLKGLEPVASRQRRSPWIWASTLLALVTIGSAIGWYWIHPSGSNPILPMKTVPFTSYPGEEITPAFSPDGNQIAFCWNGEKEDNPDIYVKLIGAGRELRLTSHPDSDTSPAWSPDGRYIAFVRNSAKTGGFYLVPALGGSERKLAEAFPERLSLPSLSYSPDGQFLAVADKNSPEKPFSIFLLSVETGDKRQLTSPAGGSRGDYNPVFSPDGKMLAFIRFSSGMANDIYLVPVAGGEPRHLIAETYFAYMTLGLAWTADGREIIFSSDREASFGLWRVPATGGIPARLAGVGPNAMEPSISRGATAWPTHNRHGTPTSGAWSSQAPRVAAVRLPNSWSPRHERRVVSTTPRMVKKSSSSLIARADSRSGRAKRTVPIPPS